MDRSDWTLLTIAAGRYPLSPVQLQKSLFLLAKNMPGLLGEDFYEFEPYDYGPFCSRIYADAKALADRGLVTITQSPGASWSEFSITAKGSDLAKERKDEAPSKVTAYLERVVEWTQRMSFRQLIESIYEAYPDYAVRSVFRSNA